MSSKGNGGRLKAQEATLAKEKEKERREREKKRDAAKASSAAIDDAAAEVEAAEGGVTRSLAVPAKTAPSPVRKGTKDSPAPATAQQTERQKDLEHRNKLAELQNRAAEASKIEEQNKALQEQNKALEKKLKEAKMSQPNKTDSKVSKSQASKLSNAERRARKVLFDMQSFEHGITTYTIRSCRKSFSNVRRVSAEIITY